jgi:hypothetical protein
MGSLLVQKEYVRLPGFQQEFMAATRSCWTSCVPRSALITTLYRFRDHQGIFGRRSRPRQMSEQSLGMFPPFRSLI